MQPAIGSNIRSLLFELATPQTAYNLREMVYETIDTFEPRANIIEVAIEDDSDRNAYNVYITYNTQVRETPQTIDVILSRVR